MEVAVAAESGDHGSEDGGLDVSAAGLGPAPLSVAGSTNRRRRRRGGDASAAAATAPSSSRGRLRRVIVDTVVPQERRRNIVAGVAAAAPAVEDAALAAAHAGTPGSAAAAAAQRAMADDGGTVAASNDDVTVASTAGSGARWAVSAPKTANCGSVSTPSSCGRTPTPRCPWDGHCRPLDAAAAAAEAPPVSPALLVAAAVTLPRDGSALEGPRHTSTARQSTAAAGCAAAAAGTEISVDDRVPAVVVVMDTDGAASTRGMPGHWRLATDAADAKLRRSTS